MSDTDFVWIFSGAGSRFSSGVFTSLEAGKSWIESHRLSGVLTQYPLNVGVYDWAVASGWFRPEKPEHTSPDFIAKFTSASQEHFHFENGVLG